MIRRPPRSTRTDTLFPYTTLFRSQQAGGLAGARIGFAEDRSLEGHDTVVIAAAGPEHRRGRHQRTLGRLDDFQMAGTARLARDAIVAGVDEADIFGRLLVEQSIAALRIGRAVVPRAGQRRLRVRALHRCEVARRSEEHTSELQSLMRI